MVKRERYKLSTSVFLILHEGRNVLLLKRENTGWMDNKFSLVAGALEPGETLENAIIRETKEEVNATIRSEDLQLVHVLHSFTEGEEWLGVFFKAEKWSGNLQINEPQKHSEIIWRPLNDLPENTIPYIKRAIECYMSSTPYSEYGW